ncbi:unnamed protein product [Rhodiola kirilowii]
MVRSSSVVLGLCLVLALVVPLPSLATDYTVGDSAGWAIGTDYDTWAKDKTFKVGDNLVFKYSSGHTVDEVKSADYSSCTIGNSISTDSSGSTTISLKTTGDHYFICGITGHCSSGMKLSVKVAAAGTTTTPPGSSDVPESSSAASLAIPALGVVVVSWVSRVVVSFV